MQRIVNNHGDFTLDAVEINLLLSGPIRLTELRALSELEVDSLKLVNKLRTKTRQVVRPQPLQVCDHCGNPIP